jgi:hypothetical protein
MVYTEVEIAASCWLPEGLLYIVPLFSKMWAKPEGLWLQQWSVTNKRPVVWADDTDSGMVLDPLVGQVAGGFITPTMGQNFTARGRKRGLRSRSCARRSTPPSASTSPPTTNATPATRTSRPATRS